MRALKMNWVCDSRQPSPGPSTSAARRAWRPSTAARPTPRNSIAGPALTTAPATRTPSGFSQDSNKLYVGRCGFTTTAIRVLDLLMNSLPDHGHQEPTTTSSSSRPAWPAVLSGKVYAANGSGKVVKFDRPDPAELGHSLNRAAPGWGRPCSSFGASAGRRRAVRSTTRA